MLILDGDNDVMDTEETRRTDSFFQELAEVIPETGFESIAIDDPIIISSQQDTREFRTHFEAQRLLHIDGEVEGKLH